MEEELDEMKPDEVTRRQNQIGEPEPDELHGGPGGPCPPVGR
jgi:hypothetical protein